MGPVEVLIVVACCFAGLFGWFGGGLVFESCCRRKGRKSMLEASDFPSRKSDLVFAASGLAVQVLSRVVSESQNRRFPASKLVGEQGVAPAFLRRLAGLLSNAGAKWLQTHGRRAGLGKNPDLSAFAALRLRYAGIGLLSGAAIGLAGSMLLAILFGTAFGIAGFYLPHWAVRNEECAREAELEQELPQMLQVVCLGLRSGLSFERSFQLYHGHFDSIFADECRMAQHSWSVGATTVEDALAELSGNYESVQLERAMWTIRRSLSLGTSLAEGLEACSRQVCDQVKKSSEERVAKASVKMLVPTAVLILPAMLLLVMGPILLELLSGF